MILMQSVMKNCISFKTTLIIINKAKERENIDNKLRLLKENPLTTNKQLDILMLDGDN